MRVSYGKLLPGNILNTKAFLIVYNDIHLLNNEYAIPSRVFQRSFIRTQSSLLSANVICQYQDQISIPIYNAI